jgi:hypothetical protein
MVAGGPDPETMSQKQIYPIRCPKCGVQEDVELYDSINVQTDANLREELMANRLNGVVCSSCAFEFRVDKSMLYHDPSRDLMIYWIPVGPDDRKRGQQEFRDTIAQMTAVVPDQMNLPEIHLVFTRTELVERIFVCEAGLNARIVEYMKYMLYLKNIKQYPPADCVFLFNAHDSSTDQLCFVIQDAETLKFESVLSYERAAYDALLETFDQDEQTATLLELFPGPYMNARDLLREDGEVAVTGPSPGDR